MTKKCNKPKANKSKRMRLKQKYSIKKKVKEHNKKMNKEAKKMKQLGLHHQNKAKEYYIPNSFPFKAEIIEQAEIQAILEKKQKANEKLEKKNNKEQQLIKQDIEEYDQKIIEIQEKSQKKDTNNQKQKIKEKQQQQTNLFNIIDTSDVILVAVDARNPIKTRQVELEKTIKNKNKKVFLILCKANLIPKEISQEWQKYLKKVSKNKTFEYRISEEEKSINSIIKGLAEEKDEDILRVGVIGYENVGKRSLINGLKKGLKEGNAEGVELKDQSGVYCDLHLTEEEKVEMNIVNVEQIADVVGAVQNVLESLNDHKQLMLTYRIPEFINHKHFLINVAKQNRQNNNKGDVDLIAAAKLVLNDWYNGRIEYYQEVPKKKV